MKHEILKDKKLTEYQKKILAVMSDASEKNYIREVFDVDGLKTTFTLTNGEDDFEDVRELTMKKLWQFDFMYKKILPSCDRVVILKHYIPEKFRYDVFKACL